MLWFKRIIILSVVLLLLAVAVYAILFTLKNTAQTNVDLVFIQFTDQPVDLIVICSFVLGGLLGLVSSVGLFLAQTKKHRKALNKVRKQL